MPNLTTYLLGKATKINHVLAWLFVVAIAYFLYNSRTTLTYGDYAPLYAGARCVMHGSNPYSVADAQAQLVLGHADMAHFQARFWSRHSLVYPPLTYYLLVPLAPLSFPASCVVWSVLLTLALVAGGVATARLSPSAVRPLVLAGVSIVLGTSSVLLRLGQISGIVIGLITIAGMLMVNRRNLSLAACLFFLAAAMKPQLALPLLVYFCLLRETGKYALPAMAAFCIASGAAGVALASHPGTAHWPSDLVAQLHSSASVGAAPGERLDTGLVNLQALTALFSTNLSVSEAMTAAISGLLILLLAIGLFRVRDERVRDWFAIAAVSILTLVVVYHRTYDMRIILLTLPALALLWQAAPKIAALFSGLSFFLLYSTALTLVKKLSPHLSYATIHGLWFRFFIERQQALFVLISAVAWTGVAFAVDRYDFALDASSSYEAPQTSSRQMVTLDRTA